MKKLICVLLCLAMLLGLAVPAFAENDTVTGECGYGASLGFLSDHDPTRTFCYSDDYFNHSGYLYDHELAKMTMDLAGSADTSVEGGWAQSNKNFIDLMQKCGFTDIDANRYVTEGPTTDSIGVNMASKQLGEYTLLAVAVRGHNYKSEWSSNFKVGASGDHQGFAEARDQVLAYIREYIAAYGVTGKIKLWLTGYSRSAVTANLVGGAIDQGFDFGENVSFDLNDLYCYTFEAPQGTSDRSCRNEVYYNIHNIINLNDIVPLISLSAWGHSRYGIDYRLPCRQLDGSYYYSLKRSADVILRNTELMTLGRITLNLIDDFRYISLDTKTALKKQNVTQIEFYQELIDLIMAEIAPSRGDYVETAQDDLRVFGAAVMGSLRELPEVLQIFGEKFLALDNLTELYHSLKKGGCEDYERAVALVEDLLVDAMAEAVGGSFDTEDTRSMVHGLAEGFVKLFMASPDTVLTLLGNILPILNAHFPEMGRTWLEVTPAEFFLAQGAGSKAHTHEADSEKFHPAQTATCTAEGNTEYYECTVYGCTAKLDADGNEIDAVLPIDPDAHSYSSKWSVSETAHWHAASCGHDLKTEEGAHCDENGDHRCDVCGYALYSVELSVSVDVIRSLLLRIPLSCTYKLTPEVSAAKALTVQYSLDGGKIWLFGTSFVNSKQNCSFKVRILDSTGKWTTFTVKDGTSVTKN